jgi:hypothetical protein
MKQDLKKKWNVCEVRISFMQATGVDCSDGWIRVGV